MVTREAISGYNVAQLCRGVGTFSGSRHRQLLSSVDREEKPQDSFRLSASGFVLILLGFRFDRVWAFSFGVFFNIYIYIEWDYWQPPITLIKPFLFEAPAMKIKIT